MLEHLEIGRRQIAYRLRDGASPTLVFFPGYASDMEGTKALALDAFVERHGLSMLRFDHSGTGSSGGNFEDGTLGIWLEDALAAVDQLTEGPLVLVGSSMGGWLALHVALLRRERVRALVGIAAAPDYTDWGYSLVQKEALRREHRIEQVEPDGTSIVTTLALWESGESLRLLDEDIAIDCPVRLVHGDCDTDVPLDVAFRTMAALRSSDVQLLVVKGGGHRLSAPHEIEAILRAVAGLLEPAP
jgi:pimeloyl-ACP methyl ester carboxylesterase